MLQRKQDRAAAPLMLLRSSTATDTTPARLQGVSAQPNNAADKIEATSSKETSNDPFLEIFEQAPKRDINKMPWRDLRLLFAFVKKLKRAADRNNSDSEDLSDAESDRERMFGSDSSNSEGSAADDMLFDSGESEEEGDFENRASRVQSMQEFIHQEVRLEDFIQT